MIHKLNKLQKYQLENITEDYLDLTEAEYNAIIDNEKDPAEKQDWVELRDECCSLKNIWLNYCWRQGLMK